MKKSLLITSLLTSASLLTAQIVEENFDYTTPADLDAQSGGTGFSTNWSNTVTGEHWITSGSNVDNASNPFAPVGGSTIIDTNGGVNSRSATRDLTTVFQPEASGASNVWYVSFMVNVPDPTADSFVFRLTNSDGSGGNLDFRNDGTTTATITTGQTGTLASAFTGGSSYFNVIKIDASNASVSVVDIGWDIYTTGIVASTDPGNGNYDVNLTATNMNSNWDFGRILLAAGASDAIQFDQIKIGTTYGSVTAVPEPSAYALLAGCLALSWVMVRRRA